MRQGNFESFGRQDRIQGEETGLSAQPYYGDPALTEEGCAYGQGVWELWVMCAEAAQRIVNYL